MERPLVIREYREEDKKGLFLLNAAVWGKPFEEKEWTWKFERGPVMAAKILVAQVNSTLVGLRAFVVEKMKIFDTTKLCGLGVDVMVNKEFRRFGVAAKMSDEALPWMEAQGIPILVGFPNEAAYQVYKRKRPYWRLVCSVPFLIKPIKIDKLIDTRINNSFFRFIAKPVLKIFNFIFPGERLKQVNDVIITKSHSIDKRFDIFWEKVSSQFNIMTVRDSPFLKWRFIEKPGVNNVILMAEKNNELAGYIILNRANIFGFDLGLIMDFIALDMDTSSALLTDALEHFKSSGVSIIGALMMKHTLYFKLLKRVGFMVAPKILSTKEFYFGVQVKPDKVANNILNDKKNWFITFADTDIA